MHSVGIYVIYFLCIWYKISAKLHIVVCNMKMYIFYFFFQKDENQTLKIYNYL
jgi:hypothetical protein